MICTMHINLILFSESKKPNIIFLSLDLQIREMTEIEAYEGLVFLGNIDACLKWLRRFWESSILPENDFPIASHYG